MNIRHNLEGMTARRFQNANIKKQNKTLEKLASGYRVNVAADDAAVLAVSQKMRARILGYSVGEDNAEDGVGFLNTADGAMMEVASMLDRMKQLTMEALNGTYTDEDRALVEMEYENLQTETDRILKFSKFNGINLFEQHEDTYYSVSGNRKWPFDLMHQIDQFNNELILDVSDADGRHKVSIKVPPGGYTTQELADEIDNALDAQAPNFPGFTMEFDTDGVFHFHNEGGTMVNEITGGLSYILYDSYSGSGYGMLLGTTQFEAGWPLSITAKNNELEFYVEDYNGNSRQLKIYVPADSYTREEMIDYLNQQLVNNGFNEIKASTYGSKCIQIGGDGYLVTGLKGNMFEIDDGIKYTSVFYDNTKYGTVYRTQGYLYGQAFYTTDPNDTAHNKVNITSANDQLKLSVDGTDYNIQLTQGAHTMTDIVNMLNTEFAAQGIGAQASVRSSGSFESLRIVSDRQGAGSSVAADSSSSAYKTLFSHTEYYHEYNVEPVNGYYTTTTPTLTGAKNLSFPLTIDGNSDTLNFTVKQGNASQGFTINLAHNTYADMNALLAELNSQLAANGPKTPSNAPMLQATNASGAIKIITTGDGGSVDSIRFASPPGNGYTPLFTKTQEVPRQVNFQSNGTFGMKPQLNFDYTMNNSNVIDSTNDTFGLYINGQYKQITFQHGTYTPEQLANMITQGFPRSEETIPNGFGTLTSTGSETVQEGSTIPTSSTAASVTIPFALNMSTQINSTNNEFKLTVNGVEQTITLRDGTYSRDSLITEINQQFSQNGIRVTASLDQGRIKLTTVDKGFQASLKVSSANGGSAMQVLAGTKKIMVSGVTASISNGKLVLTGSDDGIGMSLNYRGHGTSAPIFIGTTTQTVGAQATDRVTSQRVSYIQGVAQAEPITIDANNNRLKFNYTGSGTSVAIDFTLADGAYTYSQLELALQSNIDAALSAATPPLDGQLKVTVNRNGVRIEATSPGSQYKMSNFDGGFHKIVISGSRLISTDYNPVSYLGQQTLSPAYIVGRQDVKNKPVTIQTGRNDSLKLDFSYPQNGTAKQITLSLTLRAGTYQGDTLSAMIQDELNKALVAEGLSANLIKANVGGISTGVIGAEDDNSLNFSLNTNGISADNGTYKIDGVRGNAAFSVFYKTEGEPIPPYIEGTKDLSKGVVIPPERNDFTFKLAGVQKEILIPPGSYSAQGLINAMNQCFTDQNLNIKASLSDGFLMISANNPGSNSITEIGGGARGLIFFQEEGRIGADTDLILQVGPDSTDEFRVEKVKLNTCFLKINSICITNQTYAKKSLDRIEEAIKYLGIGQGQYGAYTNRLEHIVAVNGVIRENLTASESRMRDLDMAKEMMEQVKNSILTESSQAMMAQANQNRQGILSLLQ